MTDLTVTRLPVSADQRLAITAALFDIYFPLTLEPTIYAFAMRLAKSYGGGYWEFYSLSNGGWYMAPDSDLPLHVISDNGFAGEMSADAFGITACLYAYSLLSFSESPRLANLCAEHYHLLREYMFEHPEVAVILRAID